MSGLYDQVAYPGQCYPRTHPLRLSVAAALLGLPYAEAARARVLEIGCGDAMNLIAMAVALPEASFTGFDAAREPVERGRRIASELRLSNLRLEVLDLAEVTAVDEQDYVIAHGLYSWVPDRVREAMLQLISRSLAPHGLAMVSYNALPGGYMRQMLRDMAIYHFGGHPTRIEQLAPMRELLDVFLRDTAPGDPFLGGVREQAQGMLDRAQEVVFHDEFSPDWRAFYLHEVTAAAAAAGLEVLGDSDAAVLRQGVLSTSLRAAPQVLSGGDSARFEQYDDFLTGRQFHHSVLRRAGGAPVHRDLDLERLRTLYVCAPIAAQPAGEDRSEGIAFQVSPGRVLRVVEPELQEMLRRIGDAWPQALPIAELPGEETPLALARLAVLGHVHLQTGPWPGLGAATERPCASPLARLQLAQGLQRVITLNMGYVDLDDEVARRFVASLDGSRDLQALAESVRLTAPDVPHTPEDVASRLTQLARMGLLVQ